MKIKYSCVEKFSQDIEKSIVSHAREIVDSFSDETNCMHKNIELSICIYGALDNNVKGSIFCNDCQKPIITFTGDVLNPMLDLNIL